jgi:transcriptional regulator with XRE-family HTH domain
LRARQASGVDAFEAAEILGISEGEYGSFEKGVSFPLPMQMIALADHLNADVQSLLEKTHKNP